MAVIADNQNQPNANQNVGNYVAQQQAVDSAKNGISMHPAVAAVIANVNTYGNNGSLNGNGNGNNNASSITRSFGDADSMSS